MRRSSWCLNVCVSPAASMISSLGWGNCWDLSTPWSAWRTSETHCGSSSLRYSFTMPSITTSYTSLPSLCNSSHDVYACDQLPVFCVCRMEMRVSGIWSAGESSTKHCVSGGTSCNHSLLTGSRSVPMSSRLLSLRLCSNNQGRQGFGEYLFWNLSFQIK